MTQVTVRKVEETWIAKAKAEAKTRQVSMNTVLVEALRTGLGITHQKTNGLGKFSGSCPDDFAADWQARMDVFEKIDDDLWK
jgi:hypothetical protein